MNNPRKSAKRTAMHVALISITGLLIAAGTADAAAHGKRSGGRTGGLSAWGGGRARSSFHKAARPPYRVNASRGESARRVSAPPTKPPKPSTVFNQRAGSARSAAETKPATRSKSPVSSKAEFNRAARPRPLRTISKGELSTTFNRAAKPMKKQERPAPQYNLPAPRF